MSWSDTWTFIMDCLRDFFRGPPEVAMPKGSEHKHRFHDCRTDAEKWRRLDEILLVMAHDDDETRKHLSTISRKLSTLMTKAEDMGAQIDELQASIDAMQERVAAHLAALAQTIQELTDQINAPGDGITGAEADALKVKLQAAKDDLETTDQP